MCPSTEMLISIQKYKLQYGKISPVLSTPNNSSSEKKFQSLSKKKTYVPEQTYSSVVRLYSSFVYTTVHQYFSQYKNKSLGTEKLQKKNWRSR